MLISTYFIAGDLSPKFNTAMICDSVKLDFIIVISSVCHCRKLQLSLSQFRGSGHQVTFRKKLYDSLEMLQEDLDEWLNYYNNERTHQGKMCCGRMPVETLTDGKRIWAEKKFSSNLI